jgi:acyl dehydratase
MRGTYYDEFRVGQVITSPGRTITEADVMGFAGISGDFSALHTDEEFARNGPFGTRIAHGLLGLSILSGMTARLGILEGTGLAFLGISDWRFKLPVRIGDTVRAEFEIAELRESRDPTRGVVSQRCRLVNQNDETVQEGLFVSLVSRSPASDREAGD